MIYHEKTSSQFPDPIGFKILEIQKNNLLKEEIGETRETEIYHLQYLRPTLHVFLTNIIKQYEVNNINYSKKTANQLLLVDFNKIKKIYKIRNQI